MSATSAHEAGVPVAALCPPIEALLLLPSETNLRQEAKDTSRAEALHSDLRVLPRRFEAEASQTSLNMVLRLWRLPDVRA